MAQLKILISGAGIAGNALALWLVKLGHDVTVIERFPSLRMNGLQIDLRGHGIEVLKRMGLEEAFRSRAAPEQGLQIVDSAGKRWAFFPANKSGSGTQSFTSDFEIMRGDFCQIMYDVTKTQVKYKFGISIESFEEKGDADLQVRFSNGDTERFDLLVGADGSGSRTRKMMLGPDNSDSFQPLDDSTAYFTIPRPIQEREEYVATMYLAPGERFMMTRRSDPNKMQVYFLGKSVLEQLKDVRRGDIAEEKRAFTEVFRGAGWQVDTILTSLQATDDFYCERQGVVKMKTWSKGHVTLVGDAGYCPTSHTGMGTTSAIVGAYVLAGEIGRHCGGAHEATDEKHDSIAMALKAYEDKFRPFMEQVQKGVDEPDIFDKVAWTPFTIKILHWVLWFAALIRLDLLAGLAMKEKIKGWELPEYKELLTA